MKEAEQKYTTGEQELLAMVHALQLWRCHSDELVITIVTDHSPTTFIQTKAVLSPRQEMLSRFSSRWEYRAGRNNVADLLSRYSVVSAI